MELSQIKEILKIVSEIDVAEVELEHKGLKITVRKHAPTVMVQPAAYPPFGYTPPWPMMPPAGMPAPAPAAPAPPIAPAAAPQAEPAPAAPQPAAAAAGTAAGALIVRAPIVGTYYTASSPESPPFVEVGSSVKPGDVLCIIEAMKLMNEIQAEAAGTIRRILVQNGEAVEYDQPLFELDPA